MLYKTTVKDTNELYDVLLPSLKEHWPGYTYKIIEDKEDLATELQEVTNLGLFASSSQKLLITIDITFNDAEVSTLKNISNEETLIILVNCRIPERLQIPELKIHTKKLTIKEAQNRLTKYLSYQEIQKILPTLLADNSDYYINRTSLQTLEKQLALAQNDQNLKNAILKNIQKLSINQFNLLKAFLISPLPDAIEFLKKYLETHNLFELTASLKSQLKIAYWLKKYSPQEVEKKLKKNPFYIKSIKQTTEKFSAYKILDFIFSLENLETGIKNGKYSDPNNTFYLLIIKSRNK